MVVATRLMISNRLEKEKKKHKKDLKKNNKI
jgi:hypothetical protein